MEKGNSLEKEPPLFALWSEFTGWMLQHTEKFPKSKRMSVTLRIENLVVEILEVIVRASYSKPSQKKEYLESVQLHLNVLRVFLRLSMEQKYWPYSSYEFAVKKIDEAGCMVGGWQKYNDEKTKKSL